MHFITHWDPEKNDVTGETIYLGTLPHSSPQRISLNIVLKSYFMDLEVTFPFLKNILKYDDLMLSKCHHQGCKHILVTVCIFSHEVEEFSYRRAMALPVENLLLHRVISIWMDSF